MKPYPYMTKEDWIILRLVKVASGHTNKTRQIRELTNSVLHLIAKYDDTTINTAVDLLNEEYAQ